MKRVIGEDELVIHEWAPTHLNALLQKWFWKDGAVDVSALDVWHKSCQYLYFPRLAKSTVMQSTIAAGAASRDFFGMAYGQTEDGYRGFCLGQPTSPLMDELLLIEPIHAAKIDEQIRALRAAQTESTRAGTDPSPRAPTDPPVLFPTEPLPITTAVARPTRYFGTAELDPVKASLQFSKLVTELVELFTANHGTHVRIRVDIEAEDSRGFTEGTVRAAKENGKILGLKTSDFDR